MKKTCLNKDRIEVLCHILDDHVFADPSICVEAVLTPDIEHAIKENIDMLKNYCEDDHEPDPAEVEAVEEACRNLFGLCGPQVIGSIVYNRKFVKAVIKASKAIAAFPELMVTASCDRMKPIEDWRPNYQDLKVVWKPERDVLAAWMQLAGVE